MDHPIGDLMQTTLENIKDMVDVNTVIGEPISTGGGAVLREENVDALRRNGRLVWLDRKPEDLVPTDDRPLADSREKMAALYAAREPIYRATADERIAVTGSAADTADETESRWNA